jgi:hypothetical protein
MPELFVIDELTENQLFVAQGATLGWLDKAV